MKQDAACVIHCVPLIWFVLLASIFLPLVLGVSIMERLQ